jgi:alpha-N-arabinofuranosidase
MGTEPVLAVYAGYSLKGAHVNPGPDLEPFVQDALDEIEYVSGSATSTWGSRRARAGHPEPFRLTYVEVGNEDFFDRSGSYATRIKCSRRRPRRRRHTFDWVVTDFHVVPDVPYLNDLR